MFIKSYNWSVWLILIYMPFVPRASYRHALLYCIVFKWRHYDKVCIVGSVLAFSIVDSDKILRIVIYLSIKSVNSSMNGMYFKILQEAYWKFADQRLPVSHPSYITLIGIRL